jgi:hypothetical protein
MREKIMKNQFEDITNGPVFQKMYGELIIRRKYDQQIDCERRNQWRIFGERGRKQVSILAPGAVGIRALLSL